MDGADEEAIADAAPVLPVRRRQESGRSDAKVSLALAIPAHDPVHFADGNVDTAGSTTAPALLGDRVRFFSFTAPRRDHVAGKTAAAAADAIAVANDGPSGATASFNASRPPPGLRRVHYLRQNTVAGDGPSAAGMKREFPHLLTRAISRTYTLTSNASSSIPAEEWRPVFDKLDVESDGKADGRIPVAKFRQILEVNTTLLILLDLQAINFCPSASLMIAHALGIFPFGILPIWRSSPWESSRKGTFPKGKSKGKVRRGNPQRAIPSL